MSGLKIRKGDRVRVLTGKDRGKEGTVSRVLPAANKVVVDGVNVATRHQKSRSATDPGGIISKDMPIPVPNVALLCPADGPVRVGYRVEADGTKVRVCKKCGSVL